MVTQQTLIIGASSDIAVAIAMQVEKIDSTGLVLVSRDFSAYSEIIDDNINKILIEDYQSASIEAVIRQLAQLDHAPITQVFICHGVLHTQQIKPEKRLEDLTAASFEQVMMINALTPMLWLQKLTPLLTCSIPCKVTVFSARVGSISDNRLGGWYSYRASKAALNMMLKTAAIELARRAKNIKIIAFHPGTTDTALSKPFQKNVPPGKLFSCEFVAKQLLEIVENSELDSTLSYLDWQGKRISW
ncbi:SDR family NAD(P)-dependent oxidoreductase [Shewanella woodyi]|uniref:SDR family NAD(P)-dependent oxidoreductase n=1 Tax=Shewanella woodyi TaxID=60961 RepID=UPI0037497A03